MRRIAILSRHILGGRINQHYCTRMDVSALFSTTTSSTTTTVSMSDVTSETHEAVGLCRLDRVKKFNALSLPMIRQLNNVYDDWTRPGSPIRCIVIEGEGPKAFCAGGDVAAVRVEALEGGSLPMDFFYEEYQLNYKIASLWDKYRIAHIALWDGVTMGGGVGLSCHGRYRVATEKTTFAMPETAIGFFPDVGATWLLPRLKGGLPVGLYIGLTGVRLKAADCMYAGLATHYIESKALDSLKIALLAQGSSLTDDFVSGVLEGLSVGFRPSEEKALLQKHEEAIQYCFGEADAEEILIRLETMEKKDNEHSEWAKVTRRTLLSMSPTSIKVTIEACRRHGNSDVTIGEALQAEYRLSQRSTLQHQPFSDFYEGIRSVLVDKDPSSAVWNPPVVGAVSTATVDNYFSPLEGGHPRGELTF